MIVIGRHDLADFIARADSPQIDLAPLLGIEAHRLVVNVSSLVAAMAMHAEPDVTLTWNGVAVGVSKADGGARVYLEVKM